MKSRLALAFAAASVLMFVLMREAPDSRPAAERPAWRSDPATAQTASVSNVEVSGGPYTLNATLVRPAGNGPFRAIVYNHGSEDNPSYSYQQEIGAFFQDHGYVVLFPYRRGAAGSAGVHWKKRVDALPEEGGHEAVVRALEEENDDVLAAIDWLAKLPYVDHQHIAVAGCSFGGIQTLLTAERTDHVFAALSFAAASMSWRESPPLQERLLRAVRGARVPISLIQAENDFDTTPSRVLANTLEREHKPHSMKIYPPHGSTHMAGHAHFCNHATREWGADVLAFLDTHANDSGAHLR
jgi:dienelactone hydrolase